MRKLIVAAVSAAALLTSFATQASATVIFDFYEPEITSVRAFVCAQPTHPVPVLSITLSNPTETGSAVFTYGFPVPQPVVTDPGFAFQDFWFPFVTIEPPYFGALPGPSGYSNTTFINGGYLFSWSAVDGQLTAIRIDFNAENDDVHLGLTGGLIGSDGVIGTCEEGVCGV